MGFSIGGLVSGALGGLGGSLASGLFGQSSADKQMSFQKDMYRNRHQWEIEDLKKAGLNPILSAKGSPPSPSGASASMPLGQNSALVAAQIDKLQAETDLIETRGTKEKVTKPFFEEGGNLIETIMEKVKKEYFPNSGKSINVPTLDKVKSVFNPSSAQQQMQITKPGSKLDKVINYLKKGKLEPISTVYPPRNPASKMSQASWNLQIKAIKNHPSWSRTLKAQKMQALSRKFKKINGYQPKVQRR